MLRKEEKNVSLPDILVIKNQECDGDVTFAANKVSKISGIKTSGSIWNMAGIPPEQIDPVKETLDKTRDFLKKDIFPLFGSSIKMMLRLGRATFVETCTPDQDGKSRDMENNITADGIIMNCRTSAPVDFKEDVQSAIENPTENLMILSVRKMK